MQSISHVDAIRVIREIPTEGSSPLFVIGQDDINYYAKPIRTEPPCLEIINEFLCSFLLSYWGLNTPEVCLINIDYSLTDGKIKSNRYRKEYFDKPFFASKSINNHVEIEDYFKTFTRNDFNRFRRPGDIIKIGFFDLWIGNKDRKPKNPNILMSSHEEYLYLYPIDHGAAFCYLKYLDVRDIMISLDHSHSILTTPMAKMVAKELFEEGDKNFWRDEIKPSLLACENNIDFIFNKIPSDLGFSKKAKAHLKNFLFDNARNEELWKRAVYLLG